MQRLFQAPSGPKGRRRGNAAKITGHEESCSKVLIEQKSTTGNRHQFRLPCAQERAAEE
jgi:hypothetical protein